MAAAGTRRVTWRNLGWDGDTVYSESRGIFDSPEVGYLRMVEHVRAEEPTVIVLCYGQNEALQGDRTPEQFRAQLLKLLDDLSPTGASVVLMSPHELLPSTRPIPDPSRFNEKIRAYVEILQEAAEARNAVFVDLFSGFAEDLQRADQILNAPSSPSLIDADAHPDLFRSMARNLSDNGMHFNSRGYRAAALVVRQRLLSVPVSPAEIRIALTDRKLHVSGVEVSQVRWGSASEASGKLVQFAFRELIRSPLPVRISLTGSIGGSTDRYLAVVNDQQHGTGSEGAAPAVPDSLSIRLRFPEAIDQEGAAVLLADDGFELLRKTVVRKDELYFHRWRPQNITYLFGFRKHEQGNNAVEIAQFDPFVKKLEDEIHSLQQPRWRNISLVRED
jgi:lysophospholipase L1-like esterase